MDSVRWQQLEILVDEALELDAEARTRFLRQISGDDIRAEVESLLDADRLNNGFLTGSAAELSHDFFDADDILDPRLSQPFGRYTIVGELGRGGMGTVFLAERSDGAFEQTAAVKIVRQTLPDAATERRFRRERQILARLNHPNIARLLDGGVSAAGEPFFVMEYVDGLRIDRFCERENLSIPDRLKLFLAVCEAVNFAHKHLVVHRDIKPSNILVTKDGVPKLLDFGIARLLESETDDERTLTEYRAFTREFASPEQINGEPITTASDVYSLGVLLDRILGERSSETTELHNIATFARRDDPSRRYASADQLADDVRRYLLGLPVLAQRDSLSYRWRKFIKRHRLAVAAAAVAIIGLVGGTSIALWQAGVAREKAAIAEHNQRRAEIAAEKQKKITGFIEKVLSYASPAWYAEGNRFHEPARVLDVLNDLSGRIETEFPNDPDIQAELHHKCTEIFLANRMVDRAEAHARRALELRQRLFGDRHPDVAKDMYYLGEVISNDGKFGEAEDLYRQAAAIFHEVAPDNPNLPYLLEALAFIQIEFEDFAQAENSLAEALELHRRQHGDQHYNTARLYLQLSSAVAAQGYAGRAEELFHEGERRAIRLPSPDHRLMTIEWRARLELAKGNLDEAEAGYRLLIEEIRKLKGEDHGIETNARNLLLEIYKRKGDWRRSAIEYRSAIASLRKRVPETGVIFGAHLADLSLALFHLGETAEAMEHFEKARQILTDNQAQTANSVGYRLAMAECLLLLGRPGEALPMVEAAIAFYRAKYPVTSRQRIRAERLLEAARSHYLY